MTADPTAVQSREDSAITDAPPLISNVLSFDVEEWFHAANLRIPPAQWEHCPSRLDRPIERILSLLAEHRTSATFFVLGWVAARSPAIVRQIQQAGHEIACHGNNHKLISALTPAAFRQDVRESKAILEDLTGEPVVGYRAPGYSISQNTIWALDILESLGFAYDSSIYPVRSPHARYGLNGVPHTPHRIRPQLWEYPLPTCRLLGRRIPAATGAYLRIWPEVVTRLAFRQSAARSTPVVVNIHPWELDPDQPRMPVPWWPAMLHYTNLNKTAPRLTRLLEAHEFDAIRDLLPDRRSRITAPMQRPKAEVESRIGGELNAAGARKPVKTSATPE